MTTVEHLLHEFYPKLEKFAERDHYQSLASLFIPLFLRFEGDSLLHHPYPSTSSAFFVFDHGMKTLEGNRTFDQPHVKYRQKREREKKKKREKLLNSVAREGREEKKSQSGQ